jgi:hypothetical protein
MCAVNIKKNDHFCHFDSSDTHPMGPSRSSKRIACLFSLSKLEWLQLAWFFRELFWRGEEKNVGTTPAHLFL